MNGARTVLGTWLVLPVLTVCVCVSLCFSCWHNELAEPVERKKTKKEHSFVVIAWPGGVFFTGYKLSFLLLTLITSPRLP